MLQVKDEKIPHQRKYSSTKHCEWKFSKQVEFSRKLNQQIDHELQKNLANVLSIDETDQHRQPLLPKLSSESEVTKSKDLDVTCPEKQASRHRCGECKSRSTKRKLPIEEQASRLVQIDEDWCHRLDTLQYNKNSEIDSIYEKIHQKDKAIKGLEDTVSRQVDTIHTLQHKLDRMSSIISQIEGRTRETDILFQLQKERIRTNRRTMQTMKKTMTAQQDIISGLQMEASQLRDPAFGDSKQTKQQNRSQEKDLFLCSEAPRAVENGSLPANELISLKAKAA